MRGWVDIGEEKPTEVLAGDESGAAPSKQDQEKDKGGSGGKSPEKPPGGGGHEVTGGPVAAPAVSFPTGQIVNTENSCYLAALIHVFASHASFSDLLDPAKHPISPTKIAAAGIQQHSGLAQLVARLKDPDDTIDAADMQAFMRYLDGLGNVLWFDPVAMAKLDEEAVVLADEITQADRAFGFQQDAAEVLGNVLNLLEPTAAMQSSIKQTITSKSGAAVGAQTNPYPVIKLDIDPGVTSIADALRRFSSPVEVPDVTDTFMNDKRDQFATLPDVLTIFLNRGRQTATGRYVKIHTRVVPDDPLVIPDECMTPELLRQQAGQPARYRLVRVVYHYGRSLRSGHYTSFGKLAGTETWYKHDDTGAPKRTVPTPDRLQAELNAGLIYVYVKI